MERYLYSRLILKRKQYTMTNIDFILLFASWNLNSFFYYERKIERSTKILINFLSMSDAKYFINNTSFSYNFFFYVCFCFVCSPGSNTNEEKKDVYFNKLKNSVTSPFLFYGLFALFFSFFLLLLSLPLCCFLLNSLKLSHHIYIIL